MQKCPIPSGDAPAPEDNAGSGLPPELLERLEAMNELVAEAEDMAAEFAIEMRLEARQARREAERVSRELEK